MAFTSYDSIITAFVAGKGQDFAFQKTVSGFTQATGAAYSLWGMAGIPVAGAFGGATPGLYTAYNSATTGAIAFTNATNPDLLHIAMYSAVPLNAVLGNLLIYDRIGVIEALPLGNTTPAAQTIATGTIARYGVQGCQMFAEMQSATVAGTPQFRITKYTNQAGTTLRASTGNTATSTTDVVCACPGGGAQGRFPYVNSLFIPLQAGDSGVRSVQEYQQTVAGSTASATVNIVLAQPLAYLPISSANVLVERDLVLATVRLPQVLDNACLAFAVMPTSNGSPSIQGALTLVSG